MTHQPDSDTPAPGETIAREAEQEAFATVQRIALQAGAQIVEEPLAYSPSTILRRVDAVTGLRAARRLELAARRQLLNYIKHARQGGICWHEIGHARPRPWRSRARYLSSRGRIRVRRWARRTAAGLRSQLPLDLPRLWPNDQRPQTKRRPSRGRRAGP
jgi:hypothetical protein